MPLIAGNHNEAYKMLKAFGVPDLEHLKKAVITFEAGCIVTCHAEYYCEFAADRTNTFFREFEVSLNEVVKKDRLPATER